MFDSDPPDIIGWRALLVASALGTVALEYALSIGLWIPAARRWLMPLGIVFHIVIYVTLPVSVFSALCCLLYVTYFDPDDVHEVIDRMSGVPTPRASAAIEADRAAVAGHQLPAEGGSVKVRRAALPAASSRRASRSACAMESGARR